MKCGQRSGSREAQNGISPDSVSMTFSPLRWARWTNSS